MPGMPVHAWELRPGDKIAVSHHHDCPAAKCTVEWGGEVTVVRVRQEDADAHGYPVDWETSTSTGTCVIPLGKQVARTYQVRSQVAAWGQVAA